MGYHVRHPVCWVSFLFHLITLKQSIIMFIILNIVMELWQSGNAADSKSAEPVLSRRTGSNPVGSFSLSSTL